MLRKSALAALAICAALLVSGCASIIGQLSAAKFAVDDSLSPEESAVVVFDSPIHVREYNGVDVENTWYSKGKYRINTVTLPAGETSVLFDYSISIDWGNSITTITGEDIELRFNFEAGKEYTVAAYITKKGFLLTKAEYGVAVWNHATTGSPGSVENSIKSWKLGET
jgi:hypothetical protein